MIKIGSIAELGTQGWHGSNWTPVKVIGETPKRYRIEAIQDMRVPGRCKWLRIGEQKLVPKRALRPVAS